MSRKSNVDPPPGSWLRRLAQLCFSRRVYTSLLAPILDEMCDDHCDALAAGDLIRARFALLKGYSLFWWTVAELPIFAVKNLFL